MSLPWGDNKILRLRQFIGKAISLCHSRCTSIGLDTSGQTDGRK